VCTRVCTRAGLQRRRDAEMRASHPRGGHARLLARLLARSLARSRAFFLFPAKIDGKASGRRVRVRSALIYKRRGTTLPIIKLQLIVLLSQRDIFCRRTPRRAPRAANNQLACSLIGKRATVTQNGFAYEIETAFTNDESYFSTL